MPGLVDLGSLANFLLRLALNFQISTSIVAGATGVLHWAQPENFFV
jgi:hypothetical protein